ncbi:MAG TPA: M48 family metallopeptidase [Rhodocyclaceae bacterium]|nr:M48 family metallopeptidase [Rhodocyclaceae bacterium]
MDSSLQKFHRLGRWGFGLLLLVCLGGCATKQSTQPGVVGVERKQTLWVSASEINQASVQAYQDVLHKSEQQHALDRNPQEVARVRAIAQRLIPATAAFRSDAPGWKWETHVIDSPEVNAWCMPGGKIAVYSGLIEKLNLTDDELAAVMGHEIAHALREHGRERASQAMATGLGLSVLSAAVGASQSQTDLAKLVTDLTISLPNSRGFETEADRIGVELAARAGYDPRAALTLWQKMSKAESGGAPPQWLSTHPSHEHRQKDLADYSQRVLPLYLAAQKH